MTEMDNYPPISTLPFSFSRRTLEYMAILNEDFVSILPFQLVVDHVTKSEKSRSDVANFRTSGWNLNSRSPASKPTFLVITLCARTFLSARNKIVNKTDKIPAFEELTTSDRDNI